MSKIYHVDMSNLSPEQFDDTVKQIDTYAFTYDRVDQYTYEVSWNLTTPIEDCLKISPERINLVF